MVDNLSELWEQQADYAFPGDSVESKTFRNFAIHEAADISAE